MLLNPRYFYNSAELAERIDRIFDDNLLVIGIVSLEDELEDYSGCDLIITTTPPLPILPVCPLYRFRDA
jgi:hypothetical protein